MKIIALLLVLCGLAISQTQTGRPTSGNVAATGHNSNCSGVQRSTNGINTTALVNFYDSSGEATSTANTIAGDIIDNPVWAGELFTGFTNASRTNTVLKVRSAVTAGLQSIYSAVEYSTDGGSSWSLVPNQSGFFTNSGWSARTDSSTISDSIDLSSQLQVRYCVTSTDQASSTFTGYDIRVEYLLAGGRKGQVIVVGRAFGQNRYEWRKTISGQEITIAWTRHRSKAEKWVKIIRTS